MKKKTISAEVIADSVNKNGNRIMSYVLTFPRFILAELNTHRMFSRNSASSRAIPFKKMVKMVLDDPFIPIAWQKDHKGMQGTEYYRGMQAEACEWAWLQARSAAVECARLLNGSTPMEDHLENPVKINVTKQLCNRPLEAFMWHTAIVTATEFENFFKLRCPQYQFTENSPVFRSKADCMDFYSDDPDFWDMLNSYDTVDWLKINKGQGEIHIMELAEKMWDAMNESKPKELKNGEWHIPFGDKFDHMKIFSMTGGDDMDGESTKAEEIAHIKRMTEVKIKIATARCARVSYLNFEGKDDYEADIKLHDRLSEMKHMSPFEHCAQAIGATSDIVSIKTDGLSKEQIEKFREDWQNHDKLSSPMIVDNDLEVSVTPIGDICGNFRGWKQYRKSFEGESGVQ